ncbi:MAG: phosphoribosyltransferase family protein, partial [Bradymonadaceae bacterium]
MALFVDRRDAGRKLAARLEQSELCPDALILGLPRGGVPVAFEVARHLGRPLDVFIVRKLGVPGHGELAMGAIATGDVQVLNESLIRGLVIRPDDIAAVVAREEEELRRREVLYRNSRARAKIEGRTVVLVDDGLATGATMAVAVKAVAEQNPREIIVAVPVASGEAFRLLQNQVARIITYATPSPFFGVGAWYEDFSQTTDDEVRDLLERASHEDEPIRVVERGEASEDVRTSSIEDLIYIEADGTTLQGDLNIPRGARGLVVFAHGSGSSRFSERNRHVAEVLRRYHVGTLLMDLLTTEEEAVDRHTRHLRFD